MIVTAIVALFVSVQKRKNIGDIDVNFNHIYNNRNLNRITKDSKLAGKYNSPFIENKSMDTKIRSGMSIIGNNSDCIFKGDYDI